MSSKPIILLIAASGAMSVLAEALLNAQSTAAPDPGPDLRKVRKPAPDFLLDRPLLGFRVKPERTHPVSPKQRRW